MGNLFSKFFGTVGVIDSIRVTLVMSFWSTLIASMLGIFLGLVLEQTKFPGKKLVVRVNRTLMGAPPVVIASAIAIYITRHRTAHIYAFEKKRSVWGASMGIYDQRNGGSSSSDHYSDRLWNGIFICGPHGAFDPGVCQDDGS